MENNLNIIANHSLNVKGCKFSEVSANVEGILNGITFANADFLRLYALHKQKEEPRRIEVIRKIKTKTQWTCQEEDPIFFLFSKEQYVILEGPFNHMLFIYPHQVHFYGPDVSFENWVNEKDSEIIAFRNEWRKVFYTIVHAFGGNKIIYINDSNELLENEELNLLSFEKLESLLKKNYRNASTASFEKQNGGNWIVDYLNDIQWDMHFSLEQFYPEPDDFTTIDFDLNDFDTKEKLLKVNWEDWQLMHKSESYKTAFCYIAHLKGLIVKYSGIIGETENIELMLDKYAHTNFEGMVDQLFNAGYETNTTKKYRIAFEKQAPQPAWKDMMTELSYELKCTNNCNPLFYKGPNEGSTEFFLAADLQMALDLLKSLLVKFEIQMPFSVFKDNYFNGPQRLFEWSGS